MNEYIRTHIRINSNDEAARLVTILNSDGTTDKYIIENYDGTERVNARSLMGVIYMCGAHNNDTYLVNDTAYGVYPHGIDDFRALASID